ncbi:hypothetical protein CEXT_120851 [Caerostris extrusa]|uniref:Uncharacterized protein n=1 Tax=Caerostris extrusa TaxID=172846 RepID=A0AAV4THU7_CAEEX|nr:hypothetical protein CEXT_120851 [Caerostris extrusa]
MSHFSTQPLSYDSPYLLPPFKSESQLPESWHTSVNNPTPVSTTSPERSPGPSTRNCRRPLCRRLPRSPLGGELEEEVAQGRRVEEQLQARSTPREAAAPGGPEECQGEAEGAGGQHGLSRLRKSVPSENKNKRLSKVMPFHAMSMSMSIQYVDEHEHEYIAEDFRCA